MNTSAIRWSLAIPVVAGLLGFSSSATAQTTVVGPGSVPAPYIVYDSTDHRFVAGTEIRSTDVTTTIDSATPNGRAFGSAFAMAFYGGHQYFEGGVYEGATVSSPTNLDRAGGGGLIIDYEPAPFDVVIAGGVFRGGSVFVPDPNFPGGSYEGGTAIRTYGRNTANLTVYDGLFEGGIVAANDSPDVPVKRAPSIHLEAGTSGFFGSGKLEIFGGQFVGDVEIAGVITATIHGSSIGLDPPMDDGIHQGSRVPYTVSGVYENGEPFSIDLNLFETHAGQYRISRTPDSITFVTFVPEPSSMTLAACSVLAWLFKRRE